MTAVVSGPAAQDSLEALIAAAAGGDKVAFGQLYQRYAQNVYNLVLRSVRDPQGAEDVCQEVWVGVYRDLSSLREPAAFHTWLYRSASRACIDASRKRAIRPEAPLDEALAVASGNDPEESAIRGERDRIAWEALGALPVRQHLSIFLREVEGKNYREIAAILDTSESAVETLLFRARRGLAAAFERFQDAMPERCGQARKSMAVLLDGEANAVQRRAVQSHVDSCASCRGQLQALQRGSSAYGFVPLLPLPALLGERIFAGLGIGGGAAAGGSAFAKLLGLFTAKTKMIAATATLTGGLAVATLAIPIDTPISNQGASGFAGTSSAARQAAGDADVVDMAAAAGSPDGQATSEATATDLGPPAPLFGPALDALEDGLTVTPALPQLPIGVPPGLPLALPAAPAALPVTVPTPAVVVPMLLVTIPTPPLTLPTLPIVLPTLPIRLPIVEPPHLSSPAQP